MDQTNLRAIRVGLGRTLEEHALVAGVNASTISRLERGGQFPRPGSIRRIAEAYGMPVERLYALAILAKNANSSGDTPGHSGEGVSHVSNIAQVAGFAREAA